jgi:hypothetical protein
MIMNGKYDLFQDTPADWHLNPFADLRTVPGGWDLSSPQPSATGSDLTQQMAPGESSPTDVDPEETGYQPEKFARLRTTPASWDVSALR